MLARRIEIIIVDDHAVVREGLKRILSTFDDIAICGEAANAPDALVELRRRSFDLLLLDVSLPGRTGLELLKMIKAELPTLPVLILSAYTEDQYAVRALRDGAVASHLLHLADPVRPGAIAHIALLRQTLEQQERQFDPHFVVELPQPPAQFRHILLLAAVDQVR